MKNPNCQLEKSEKFLLVCSCAAGEVPVLPVGTDVEALVHPGESSSSQSVKSVSQSRGRQTGGAPVAAVGPRWGPTVEFDGRLSVGEVAAGRWGRRWST